MATVTIEVTQEDIDKGEIDCQFCPIALAITRTVGIVPFVSVSETTIHIDNQSIPTPMRAMWFIGAFDGGDDVEPFAFDLDLPDELLPAK